MTVDINSVANSAVYDRNGDKIGTVGQVYVHDKTDQPSFVTVKTGLFGTKETFVPIDNVEQDGDNIRVPFEKSFVKDAPNVDHDRHITPEEEDAIYRYYAQAQSADAGRHDEGFDGNRHDDHAGPDAAMGAGASMGAAGVSRVNERDPQRDDNRQQGFQDNFDRDEAGAHRGMRLRRYTVTETRTIEVPVQREEVEVVDADGNPVSGAQAEAFRDQTGGLDRH